jgi:hypothetical protein
VAGYEAAADAVYETLRERRFDVSRLSTRDLLRKDYKQWAMGGGGAAAAVVGVASVGMDLRSMAAKDVRMADECARWSEHCGLDLLVIMVGTLQPPAPAAPPHTHRLCELSDWLDRLGRSSVSHGEVIREHRESCVCVCVRVWGVLPLCHSARSLLSLPPKNRAIWLYGVFKCTTGGISPSRLDGQRRERSLRDRSQGEGHDMK